MKLFWPALAAFCLLMGCQRNEPAGVGLSPQVPRTISPALSPLPDDARTLRVFIHEKGFPPLDFGLSSGHPQGIYPEILDALCRKAGFNWRPVPLPAGRVYEGFRSQESNVEIGCNPAWRQVEADISLYTQPFATDSNVIVFRKKERFAVPKPGDKPSSKPRTMGTVIGYVYPDLEQQFKAGTLIREDVTGEKTLLDLLAAKRVDAVIITRLVALYYMKTGSYDFELSAPRDELPLSIRLHTSLSWALEPLNRALRELASDGTIETIYRKYR